MTELEPTLRALVPNYVTDEGLLHCPADSSEEPSFLYVPGLSLTEADAMLVVERGDIHAGGRHVLFLDGRVEWMPEEPFQARWAQQREKFKLPGLEELGDTTKEKQPSRLEGKE